MWPFTGACEVFNCQNELKAGREVLRLSAGQRLDRGSTSLIRKEARMLDKGYPAFFFLTRAPS